MELAIYAAALGISAAVIVPIIYSAVASFLPANLTTGTNIPTAVPANATAVVMSVILWGVFLGLAIWLVSFVKPVGSAVRSEA